VSVQKAAWIAFNDCAIWQVAWLQRRLRDAGWVIRTLTLGARTIQSDGGVWIHPHEAVESAAPRDFALLILSGEVDEQAVGHPGLHRFFRQYDGTRGCIAACGAAVVYLAAAGLLNGLRFTGPPKIRQQYAEYFARAIYVDEPVCIDGNVITAQDQATVRFADEVCVRLGVR
jgi:putative intracellular protease/amidase